jgi:DNA helicase-4
MRKSELISDSLKLSLTFRCPEEICKASTDFIQKNPLQIQKDVRTTSTVQGKAIQCYAAKSEKELPIVVEGLLHKIAIKLKTVWDQPRRPTVLLLGRYSSDRPYNMPQLKRTFGASIDIDFSTVHRSKGTEADYVLVLNVTDGHRGFPSKIEDDPVLQSAMPLGMV